MGNDYEFDVNLVNITGSDTVSLKMPLRLSNKNTRFTKCRRTYFCGSHFSTIKVAGQTSIDINLDVSADTTLSTTGSSKDLIVNASGKSVTLSSSTATQDIIINNSYDTDIAAASALRNVAITSNGDVTLRLECLKRNIMLPM